MRSVLFATPIFFGACTTSEETDRPFRFDGLRCTSEQSGTGILEWTDGLGTTPKGPCVSS